MTQARNLGAMRHRVKLQKPVRTPDGGGGFTVTMTDVDTVYASIEPAKSGEIWAAQQNRQIVTHSIVIRFNEDAVEGGNLTDEDGTQYYIEKAWDKEARKRWTSILARQGGPL